MKYDDWSYHSGGEFPADLPAEAGATHTGMFVAWALLSGLSGRIHIEDCPEDLPRLQTRQVTPGSFFLEACDGKFTDEDLSEEGNAFAREYFDFEKGQYLRDYELVLGGGLASLYHVADTWENYDRLAPCLDQRLDDWRLASGRAGTA